MQHARRALLGPHLQRGAVPAADRGDAARARPRTSGCACATRTSASPAARTGTCGRAGASSACSWAGGGWHQLRLPVSHLTWDAGPASAVGRRGSRRTRAERDVARRAAAARAPGAASSSERPPAPWGSFPLSELVILARHRRARLGAASAVATAAGERVAGGLVLASLGGGELALREHLGGFRSHSALLAGVATFVVITVIVLALGPVKMWVILGGRRGVRRVLLLDARAVQATLGRAELPVSAAAGACAPAAYPLGSVKQRTARAPSLKRRAPAALPPLPTGRSSRSRPRPAQGAGAP